MITSPDNGKNIVRAKEVAKEKGDKILGLDGYRGGKVKKMADECLCIDIDNRQVVEDIQLRLDRRGCMSLLAVLAELS